MSKENEDFTLVRDQIMYKQNIEVNEHKKLLLCVVQNFQFNLLKAHMKKSTTYFSMCVLN